MKNEVKETEVVADGFIGAKFYRTSEGKAGTCDFEMDCSLEEAATAIIQIMDNLPIEALPQIGEIADKMYVAKATEAAKTGDQSPKERSSLPQGNTSVSSKK